MITTNETVINACEVNTLVLAVVASIEAGVISMNDGMDALMWLSDNAPSRDSKRVIAERLAELMKERRLPEFIRPKRD